MAVVRMRLFLTVKKFYETLGIHLPQPNQKYSIFNAKNLFILFILIQMCLTSTAFVLFKAKSEFEYGFPTYVSITEVLSIIYLCIQMWKIEDILKLMKKCDEFIEKS